ncbi:hypothetical protein HanIR_Chr02g0085291 [Helianthus annuus]|nr:hypothetical protein HanIR_Chr02g0085291 [Helianthus annuus]
MHKATPGGTDGVKTIGNYAMVMMSIVASYFLELSFQARARTHTHIYRGRFK